MMTPFQVQDLSFGWGIEAIASAPRSALPHLLLDYRTVHRPIMGPSKPDF